MIAMLLFATSAAATEVVCTLPWLADVAGRLDPAAEITVLATGNEDPHYLSPTPALMAKVGRADLYIENGMGLELWSERLLDGAGNPSIRRGQPGHVLASTGVPRLEVPTELTRAQGDLHPEGNPHVWLDPLNIAIVGDNIAAGLSRVDPDNASVYAERAAAVRLDIHNRMFGEDLVAFMGGDLLDRLARSGKLDVFLQSKDLDDRLGGWLAKGRPLAGKPVVFYHRSWVYLVDRFGLDVVGYIEERPGIAPSASHRTQLEAAMTSRGVTVIGVTSYYDDRLANVLSEGTGARVARLPADVGGTPQASDYLTLIDVLLDALGG